MPTESIYSLISFQAARRPDAIAILADDRTITYKEVLGRADAVSSLLKAAGLGHEESVAVLMSRRADLVGTLLGIWKAGGAYLPIDPGEPPSRARQMLDQSGCRRIIGDSAICDPVVNFRAGSAPEFIDATNISLPPASAQADADESRSAGLAYLLFTSGSTGEPKAVEVEHRSVLNLLHRARNFLEMKPSDRYLAVSTIGFDISVVELFLPLLVGGSVVLRDKDILLEPIRLARLVREAGITVMQTGPSVWSVLLNEVPNFPRLRVAISTGEAIAPRLAEKLCHVGDAAWNLYGPTETTIWVTGCRLRVAGAQASGTSAPIGTPFEGVTARVVGDDLQESLPGERGELLIGGICLARGYRNRDDLTREKFNEIGGERFYRTGDLVSRDNAGVFQYFGRLDDQMKIRGIRVEPREIEEVIRLDPRVREVAATWFETQSGTRAIVAAVVIHPGTAITAKDLYKSLEEKLPSTLIPAKFLFVPWLPINKNGKVDLNAIRTAALPAEPPKHEDSSPSLAEQVSPTELAIAGIWKRMMGLERIASDAHFFAIGGDSLSAVVMTNHVESILGLGLPTQLVLEAPELKEFARRVEIIKVGKSVERKARYIFRLVERPGTAPLFFCGFHLSVVSHWNLPCSLYALVYWAEGADFVGGDTIEEMAARYIEGIIKQQPFGPYQLAGYSFGAILIFEIARQLASRGEKVEFLFLLDPYEPFHRHAKPPDHVVGISSVPTAELSWRIPSDIKQHVQRANPLRQTKRVRAWLASLLLPIERVPGGIRFAYWVAHMHRRHPNPVSRGLVARWQWPMFWFAARKKLVLYKPASYLGRAMVVLTEGQRGQDLWASILDPNTDFRIIKADHQRLFDYPEIEFWLPWLREQVAKAQLE